jgi:4-hydroxy-3-methylbut-2-enyl diphosphate reductase
VTQTTLSPADVDPVVEALRARFPSLALPRVEDICFATRNRQHAVRWLAESVDLVLVLGDSTSSNSIRLREVAESAGTPARLIGTIADLDPAHLDGVEQVGLTAGASTPEDLVQAAVRFFADRGARIREETLLEEPVFFPLPAPVRGAGRVEGTTAR